MFDIKNESLGFPQFIGELTVVPFLYSMSVRYLIDHPTKTTIPVVVAFVAFSGEFLLVICTTVFLLFKKLNVLMLQSSFFKYMQLESI